MKDIELRSRLSVTFDEQRNISIKKKKTPVQFSWYKGAGSQARLWDVALHKVNGKWSFRTLLPKKETAN